MPPAGMITLVFNDRLCLKFPRFLSLKFLKRLRLVLKRLHFRGKSWHIFLQTHISKINVSFESSNLENL